MRQTISGLVAAIAVMIRGRRARDGVRRTVPAGARRADMPAPARRPSADLFGLQHRLRRLGLRERLPDPVQQYGVAPMALAAILLRQPGPDLYRSRQLRALSGLSGKRGILGVRTGYRLSRRSLRLSATTPHHRLCAPAPRYARARHGMRYGYGASSSLRLSPARAAPLLLIAEHRRKYRRPFASRERASALWNVQPIRPSLLAPI